MINFFEAAYYRYIWESNFFSMLNKCYITTYTQKCKTYFNTCLSKQNKQNIHLVFISKEVRLKHSIHWCLNIFYKNSLFLCFVTFVFFAMRYVSFSSSSIFCRCCKTASKNLTIVEKIILVVEEPFLVFWDFLNISIITNTSGIVICEM